MQIGNLTLKGGNYTLLISLCFMIFIIPLFPPSFYKLLFSGSFVLIFILATLSTGDIARKIFAITVILVVTEILSAVLNLKYLEVGSRLLNLLFFYFVVGYLIYSVAKSKEVNFLTVIEAINGYLLMGLAFVTLITIVQLFNPQAFSVNMDPDDPIMSMPDIIYYSFVTITTLGYGDIVPTTPYAKSIATFISLSGQIYIAVIIAMLVGKYSSKNS